MSVNSCSAKQIEEVTEQNNEKTSINRIFLLPHSTFQETKQLSLIRLTGKVHFLRVDHWRVSFHHACALQASGKILAGVTQFSFPLEICLFSFRPSKR